MTESGYPPPRARLGNRGAVAVTGAIVVTLLAASSAPSPLYPYYEGYVGLSHADISLAFSGYPVGLLIALLITGSISDHLGRKPVILGALAGLMASMLILLVAQNTLALVTGRFLEGTATGVALGAVGAYLVEVVPPTRPGLASLVNSAGAVIGTAVGAVLGGAAAIIWQTSPMIVFGILFTAFTLEFVAMAFCPETWRRVPGLAASLMPKVYVPSSVRGRAVWTMLGLFLAWSLSSVTLALAPVLLRDFTDGPSAVYGGLVVLTMCLPGALATFLLARYSATTIMLITVASLVPSAALSIGGIYTVSLPLYLGGTAIGGIGVGASLLGALRVMTPASTPEHRAGVISAVYIAAYLGLAVPAVVVGAFATGIGLQNAVLGYQVVLGLVAIANLIGLAAMSRSPDPR